MDLLVDNGIIYELKTVSALNDSHKQQLINYLLLTGIKHTNIETVQWVNFNQRDIKIKTIK